MNTTENKVNDEAWEAERIKAVLQFAELAHKSCIMINGGAVLSLLTFYGNFFTKSTTQAIPSEVTYSLIAFAIGVFLAALSTGSTYLAQINFSENENLIVGKTFRWLSVGLVVIAYGLFIYGVYATTKSFEYLIVTP